MEKGDKTCKVGRVEDDDNVLDIRAVSLDILSELLGDLAVAFQQVLPGHSLFTRSSTRRNDVFCVFVGLLDICSIGDVRTIECAMEHFLDHSFESLCIRVIQAEVRSKSHHHSGLCHIRADHTGGTHYRKLFICQKVHNTFIFYQNSANIRKIIVSLSP